MGSPTYLETSLKNARQTTLKQSVVKHFLKLSWFAV